MSVPNTLDAIRIKVRRLTRSPSDAQITNNQIDNYVNTFLLYDFPEHLRLFTLREKFTFYTIANIDVYDSTNSAYDKDLYISVHPPVYIAGYQSFYSQSREQFFRIYPELNFDEDFGTGDGAQTLFTSSLTDIPILRNCVTVSAQDTSGNRLLLIDDGNGNLTGDGIGAIDYLTGAISITFSTPPGIAEEVNAQYVPYVASRPEAMLFFANQLVLRPVPDKVYKVETEVYKRPTALLSGGQAPELEQWWQYIAYGTSKKIFEDRMDMESISKIMPEFNQQQRLVLRRTIDQNTNERVATIYSEQITFPYGFNNRGAF